MPARVHFIESVLVPLWTEVAAALTKGQVEEEEWGPAFGSGAWALEADWSHHPVNSHYLNDKADLMRKYLDMGVVSVEGAATALEIPPKYRPAAVAEGTGTDSIPSGNMAAAFPALEEAR